MAESVKYGLQGNAFNDVNAALKNVKLQANAGDLILICGSLFVIGELEI